MNCDALNLKTRSNKFTCCSIFAENLGIIMASHQQEGQVDTQLFQLLSNLLQQVEALTNQEEVELRAKIEALGLEVKKVPSKSANNLDELEIARELDKLSAKLDDVDEMISSAMASDPQVQSLLSSTADIWMPVITATAEERRNFTASSIVVDDAPQEKPKRSSN